MKITKKQLEEIIHEELALMRETRSIEEVVADMEESFQAAHKDLQTFALHLKQSGMDPQVAEQQIKALENIILTLDQELQPVQESKDQDEDEKDEKDDK
tara:strand:- start:120 stop:416 length:297 start_codon:yes stop_codon:yes gene_type:complete